MFEHAFERQPMLAGTLARVQGDQAIGNLHMSNTNDVADGSTAFGLPVSLLKHGWVTVKLFPADGVEAKYNDDENCTVHFWALQARWFSGDKEGNSPYIDTRVVGMVAMEGHPALWEANSDQFDGNESFIGYRG